MLSKAHQRKTSLWENSFPDPLCGLFPWSTTHKIDSKSGLDLTSPEVLFSFVINTTVFSSLFRDLGGHLTVTTPEVCHEAPFCNHWQLCILIWILSVENSMSLCSNFKIMEKTLWDWVWWVSWSYGIRSLSPTPSSSCICAQQLLPCLGPICSEVPLSTGHVPGMSSIPPQGTRGLLSSLARYGCTERNFWMGRSHCLREFL